MPDVIVVGAGIVGAAVACRLAQRGAAVTVVERRRPAGGTTSTSFAWANAHNKPPRPYHNLNAAGLAEHHRIVKEAEEAGAAGGGWFHPTGCLQWATEERGRQALRDNVARLQEWGYRAEWLDADRAAELEPDLLLPPDGLFAFYPDEGWVAAPILVHHLLEQAVRAGATVVYPDAVLGLQTNGGRVTGVRISAGDVSADVVVDCTGRDAGRLLEPLGLGVARQRSPGLLVATEPLPTCLQRVVLAPDLNLRPDGAGRVLLQSGSLDDALETEEDPQPTEARCAELVERATAVLPVLAGARVEAARLGWRAMPGDGFTAVGPVLPTPGYYLVFTHSGITMGPLLGRLAASELTTGHQEPLLATFRPDRLVSAEAPTG